MLRPILQCNAWFGRLAYDLLPAMHLSDMVGLLLWGCTEPGMASCSGTGKTAVFGVCGCVGVGYCTNIVCVNEIEHSPCSFSLLG